MNMILRTEFVLAVKLLAAGYANFWLYVLAAISPDRLRRCFTPH